MSFRRAHSNFVNLGRLYSIPPWRTVTPHGLVKSQNNFVNLGTLYAPSKSKDPAGWAYFDDGSVFILPYVWVSHDAFEACMKIAAQFVRSPTPKMHEVRKENPHMKRFIVIKKDGDEIPDNVFRILARNAQDGQRVSVADPPFENVALSLDPTGSRPIFARFNDAPQLRFEHRLRNTDALETFRGTLVNGILQPNVRLGNGLRLSNKPEILKPQITEKRRARNHEAARPRESGRLPPKASAKSLDRSGVPSSRDRSLPTRSARPTSPPQKRPRDHDLERREHQIAQRERELIQLQQQLLLQTMRNQIIPSPRDEDGLTSEHRTHESAEIRADTTLDTKAAEIEAQERALEQGEELLRYKRKTWLLEQKLAQASARSPPRRSFRKRETDVQEQDVPTYYEPEAGDEATSDPQYDGSGGEQPDDYSLHNPSPPDALADLRSRIQLPTRKTIRSNRDPR